MQTWKKAAVAVTLSVLGSLALADTLAEAKTMLAAAQAEVASKGLTGAAAEFNAGGKWRARSTYVVLVSFEGHMHAHSDNLKIVGKNMLQAKDAAGRPFVHETLKNVQAGNESLVELRWANPNTKKIDTGHMLARRVAGQDAYVGVVYFD